MLGLHRLVDPPGDMTLNELRQEAFREGVRQAWSAAHEDAADNTCLTPTISETIVPENTPLRLLDRENTYVVGVLQRNGVETIGELAKQTEGKIVAMFVDACMGAQPLEMLRSVRRLLAKSGYNPLPH